MKNRPTLDEIILIADEAGKILREGFGNLESLDLKGKFDVVTEVDRQSENFLVNTILTKFPDHGIIAEESGLRKGKEDKIWYIDPLDGTTNFAHNLPIFSVSIAYVEGGEVCMSVVYDPIRDETFSAEIGKGAFLNGEPISVGLETSLSKSLMVTGFPYDRFTNPDNNIRNFSKMATKVRGIRRMGSAALDLCYVAANRVSGYWEIRLETWDLAAGMLIAEEAGAKVTKRDGRGNMLNPPISVIAANPNLHNKILEILLEN